MAKGLYYYKLVSPYSEDVTKNCKLTINEIDNNFIHLKDADIKSAELDEETNAIVLTKNDGDKLVVDLSPALSGAVYDLKVVYENPSENPEKGASVYVTYSTLSSDDSKVTVTVPITGLVTVDNVNDIVDTNTTVITNSSLTGNGTADSPLGISDLYNASKPAIKLIDNTNGETLPETPMKGDKYVTKEYISDFGNLYNFEAVKKINEALEAEGKGWRVPTKADWDCLLNSIEPCEKKDHDSAICHQFLGKYAGVKLKSTCGWLNQDECTCNSTEPIGGSYCGDKKEEDAETDEFDVELVKSPTDGTDEFGMRILPTGYGDGDEFESMYYKKKTAFWTTTHINNDVSQDIYIKEFVWNKSGVLQEAQCPESLYAIRLVKDFNGSNHFDSEIIDGNNYQTKLFAECNAVWTTSNFASTKEKYNAKAPNMALTSDARVVYFVNMWNGKDWEKRMLSEGETVTIQEPVTDKDSNPKGKCQYNIDYRVFKSDECNQLLINDDDAITVRVLDEVMPLIGQETEERKAADEELKNELNEAVSALTDAIKSEEEERKAADDALTEMIEDETARATNVEQQLWDALNNEVQNREQVDQQLWDALNDEAAARQEVDNQIWSAITEEAKAREQNVADLWDGINGETERAQAVEAQLWEGINGETERAQKAEADLWEGINKEAAAREEVDNMLWDALNAEIARATEAEETLDKKIDKEIEDRIADVDEEEARAKGEEKRIEDQIIDNPANPQNENTPNEYVIKAGSDGDSITLFSKGGTNDITIKFDADFGTF